MTAFLCAASVPTGALVVAGHALVCVLVAVSIRGESALGQLVKRLAVVFGAITLLCLQLLAPVLSRAGSAVETAWNEPDAGSGPFTTRFARELAESVTAGSGPAVLGAVVMLVAVGSFVASRLVRSHWPLMLALALGPLLHVVLVVVRGLALSPRFLLALLFPAIFVAVEAARRIAAWLAARRSSGDTRLPALLEGAMVALVALALVAPLADDRCPKQPYRAALSFAAGLDPDALLVGVYTASSGVVYYGIEHPDPERDLEGRLVVTARTREQLGALLEESAGRPLGAHHLAGGEPPRRASRSLSHGGRRAASREVVPGRDRRGDITVWLPRP